MTRTERIIRCGASVEVLRELSKRRDICPECKKTLKEAANDLAWTLKEWQLALENYARLAKYTDSLIDEVVSHRALREVNDDTRMV